jgi:hypothetical protein
MAHGAAFGSEAAGATARLKYSPFDADGTLRDGLSVASGGIGGCTSGRVTAAWTL